MKRAVVVPFAVLPLVLCAAPAQLPWNDAGSEIWRKELEAKSKEEAVFPLSPNVILGRTRFADPKTGTVVLLLDRTAADPRALLVARDADCTPRALLRPVATERGSGTVVCETLRGAARPDMEIVLPGSALTERCRTTLPERKPETRMKK